VKMETEGRLGGRRFPVKFNWRVLLVDFIAGALILLALFTARLHSTEPLPWPVYVVGVVLFLAVCAGVKELSRG